MGNSIELGYRCEVFSINAVDRTWLAERMGRARIKVFLPSTSVLRQRNVQEVVDQFGIPVTAKTVNGPAPEVGDTTAARAEHKTMHVFDILRDEHYLERNQDMLIVVIAMDSRNRLTLPGKQPVYRDKPPSLDLFGLYHAEWDTIGMGEGSLVANTAYAVTAVFGGRVYSASIDDFVRLQPRDRHAVARAFLPLDDKFLENRRNAHGFSTAAAITDGDLLVSELDGSVITGQPAINRVYGADPQMIGKLFDVTLAAFIR